MATSRNRTTLAYDDEGAGTPVVFLHGLTFDRRSWRPVVERLGGSVRAVTIDLPAHGETAGAPAQFDEVCARTRALLDTLAVKRPIVVGHSMSGGIACLYATANPTLGVVSIDNGPHIRPFAELVRRLEPALRGTGFADVWRTFESSLGLERLRGPERSLLLAGREVSQDVVLGYWEMLLRTDPAELQAWIDGVMSEIRVPLLAVFGRTVTDEERARLDRLPHVQVEEWAEGGHCVHLADPDRFAGRLRRFVDSCAARGREAGRAA